MFCVHVTQGTDFGELRQCRRESIRLASCVLPLFVKMVFVQDPSSFDTWSHSRDDGGRSDNSWRPPRPTPPPPPSTMAYPSQHSQQRHEFRHAGHSWDSDSQFPIKEIERIRKKTKKIRGSRPDESPPNVFHSAVDVESEDGAFEVIQRSMSSATGTTDGSSVRKRAPRTWSADAASKVDSLQEIMDQTDGETEGESSTERKTPDISNAALRAREMLVAGFKQPSKRNRPRQDAPSAENVLNISDPITEATNTSAESSEDKNLQLHDLCGEAVTTDDIAWRNALYLLSVQPELAQVEDQGWTPLHICCLGSSPPPSFIVRALLYSYGKAARIADDGGRLPLHLVAASSGDIETMQLLVDEYPAAVYQADEQGWTPLNLLLRNMRVELTPERARVLLGLTIPAEAAIEQVRQKHILLRRRQHLGLDLEALEEYRKRTPPVTTFHKDIEHEAMFETYPADIQGALRRLGVWKRHKRNQTDDDEVAIAVEDAVAGKETNPAAIPSPTTFQLPIHALVRRSILDPQTLERPSFSDDTADTEAEDEEVSTETDRPSVQHPYDILRMVVACYPEGLVCRDSDGYTPLLLAMASNENLPTLEVVELLLGKRSAGHEQLPAWAEDMPLHRLTTANYSNPAMVPTVESRQLPLHLAAEELLSDFAVVQTIYESYPGAIQVQDLMGRTPLHVALRSYRRVPVEPKVFALLFSDRVAQVRDDHGHLPMDILLEGSDMLPMKPPFSWYSDSSGIVETSTVYERFIHSSIVGAGRPENKKEADSLLGRLRSLPPWLRRQACSTAVVQELLVEDLANPLKTAMLLFDGFLLIALITVFRIQMEKFVDARRMGENLQTWYSFAVYALATVRLLFAATYWVVAASLRELQYLCLLNPWSWIDVSAMMISIVSSIFLYGPMEDERLFSLGTIATGMLWLGLLGYLATWWHGVAVFTGGLSKISSSLVWPFLIFSGLSIAFAQMFYTLLQIDCLTSLGVTTVCTVRDAYRVVYMLLRGEGLVDLRGAAPMASSAAVLIGFFLLFLVLFCVSLLVTVLVAASKLDFETIAMDSYWEQKLAAFVSAEDFGIAQADPARGSRSRRFYWRLEQKWHLLTMALTGGETKRKKHWYSDAPNARALAWSLPVVAIVVLPIWMCVGACTFGLLWPPQLRRKLFRPWGSSSGSRKAKKSTEQSAEQVVNIQDDIRHLKEMSFERTGNVEKELRELKELLSSALKEA